MNKKQLIRYTSGVLALFFIVASILIPAVTNFNQYKSVNGGTFSQLEKTIKAHLPGLGDEREGEPRLEEYGVDNEMSSKVLFTLNLAEYTRILPAVSLGQAMTFFDNFEAVNHLPLYLLIHTLLI